MTEESKTSTAQTDDGDKEPLKVTFSLPQILGGALAAATAATIGSTLGVAGTIIGASVASVIGGVAGTLYSAGLDRTHRRARTAMKRVYSRVRVAEPSDGETAATAEGMPEAPDEVAAKTEVLAAPTGSEGSESRRDWRPILKRMAITVVAIFVVTLGVITAIELGLGSSLDGSGGTTVGQVTVPKSRPTPTATETVTVMPTPAASPTGPAPSPSQTPSFSPTPEPSISGASELPTATAT
ncbi:hypothetical protein [Propionicimonas sp.]|uniref:hypothetical protein n=1 Tax=Propionicimonas sp. TaxID=1955623 RepID=UPI0017AB292F|nr:hypothetical protein [Propionicimonas sp.]MBU3976707.1 hypothetical protein [Actinomycetota bacterium]MBA3019772.1 hypothetical protein [Propionicimonas sp.]MBU3986802.1 hypothetical protein [Actinomycetota bacterium]MBU4006714.1 hypothetical protein [Actinomycetota bacterium]MBU4065414.1 hypothetical protein [Actinomycetota bacterium]